jgi:cytochrome c biogenesis protein CcmG, thiol:disulfide interchange protein DsbE
MKTPSTASNGPSLPEIRGRIGWVRFAPVVLLALVVAAMLWRLANPPDTIVHSQMIGKPAPQFSLDAAIPGKQGLSSAQLSDGKPKLVHFFASWCVPCIGEAPVLDELKRRGILIEGIAIRDSPEELAQFLGRNADPFDRIGSDPESKTQLAFGSSGVPETFVVDGRGTIRVQHIGAIAPDEVSGIIAAVEQAK